jgi:hypothetical protein
MRQEKPAIPNLRRSIPKLSRDDVRQIAKKKVLRPFMVWHTGSGGEEVVVVVIAPMKTTRRGESRRT